MSSHLLHFGYASEFGDLDAHDVGDAVLPNIKDRLDVKHSLIHKKRQVGVLSNPPTLINQLIMPKIYFLFGQGHLLAFFPVPAGLFQDYLDVFDTVCQAEGFMTC